MEKETENDKKIALVTGGSRGIGAAIARRLAADGFHVIVNYNGSAGKAEALCEEIHSKGGSAESLQADVSKKEEVEAMFSSILQAHSHLDVLVNNAGITRDGLLLRMSEADFEQVLNTNLKGAFLCLQAAVRPMMKHRSGRIINISSVSGVAGNAGQANYSAAKAGILGLTKSAAKELASRNITVNAIAPGFIETDMTAALSERVREAILAQIPLARFGQAEDVAAAAAFLASEESRYMTGQTLHVDGGMFM